MRSTLIIFIILLFSSCAKNPVEEVNEAIDIALTYLSSGKCDDALDVLNDAGNDNDNAIYLQVLASAHACKAGFNEIAFIADDLTSIDVTSPENTFKSLSILSMSSESSADSANFTSILTGINVLLNSTDGAPSQAARTTKFKARKAGDMGFQALILNIVNLGKFFNYYGNVSSSGVKGGGAAGNTCFINYNDPRAQILTGVSTGACTSDTDGHADLDQSTADGKRRMCEGLMLLTNIFDIMENLDFSQSSTLSIMTDVQTQITTYKTNAVAAGLSDLINMTSQSKCETYLDTPSQLLDMEFLYAIIYESGLQ